MNRRPPARHALFPGTFDPFTNGHLDLATRAAGLFPRVVIAVARASTKTSLFSAGVGGIRRREPRQRRKTTGHAIGASRRDLGQDEGVFVHR